MALTPKLVAEIVRQRLGEIDGANHARYITAIPDALKAVSRKVAANPHLRDLLISDKATTTLAIASGIVDLTTGYTTHNFLKEYLDYGQIYHSSFTYPLRKRTPQSGRFTQSFTQDFGYYYIEADKLYLTDTALTGNLSFAVPTMMRVLADMPESEEVERMLIDKIIEMVGAKDAEDGEK